MKKEPVSKNIFVEENLGKDCREDKQGHLTGVFWLTGLSGSGKTTIAQDLIVIPAKPPSSCKSGNRVLRRDDI